jgi:hypothetical protein
MEIKDKKKEVSKKWYPDLKNNIIS